MKLFLSILFCLVFSFTNAQPRECNFPVGEALQNNCIQSLFPDTTQPNIFYTVCYTYHPSPYSCADFSFLIVNSLDCGVKNYSNLTFSIYDENCDSLVSSGSILPSMVNTHQCLDTSKNYIICYRFKPSCHIYSACPIIQASALPVDWIFFRGSLEESTIHLLFATAQETQANYFNVQKLDSCYNFRTVKRLQAHGTSYIPHVYEFLDKEILEHNYYRVQQVDFNSSSNFSDIIVVNSFYKIIDTQCSYYNILGSFCGFEINDLPKGNIYIRQCKDSYKSDIIYK